MDRIAPARPPFPAEVQDWLDRITPKGRQPLRLFTTLARDPRLFGRFFSGGLLDRGNLSMRQREIIILRTVARCACDYEWGIHRQMFAERVGLNAEQLSSLASGVGHDLCWPVDEAILIQLCDSLVDTRRISQNVWEQLSATYSEEAILECIMLCGFYTTVSYLANGLALSPDWDTRGIRESV